MVSLEDVLLRMPILQNALALQEINQESVILRRILDNLIFLSQNFTSRSLSLETSKEMHIALMPIQYDWEML
jgi:hypothetical protein